jgi:hypothetical protein
MQLQLVQLPSMDRNVVHSVNEAMAEFLARFNLAHSEEFFMEVLVKEAALEGSASVKLEKAREGLYKARQAVSGATLNATALDSGDTSATESLGMRDLEVSLGAAQEEFERLALPAVASILVVEDAKVPARKGCQTTICEGDSEEAKAKKIAAMEHSIVCDRVESHVETAELHVRQAKWRVPVSPHPPFFFHPSPPALPLYHLLKP